MWEENTNKEETKLLIHEQYNPYFSALSSEGDRSLPKRCSNDVNSSAWINSRSKLDFCIYLDVKKVCLVLKCITIVEMVVE